MIDEAALEDLRDRHSIEAVALDAGATLRKSGRGMSGSCPVCSTKRSGSSSRFEIKAGGRKWVCAVCCDGGDVIRLVQLIHSCDFRAAVEILGGAREVDKEEAARNRREREARETKRLQQEADHKERERERLYRHWRAARPLEGSLVEIYLAARGLALPATRVLRFAPEARYYHGMTTGPDGRPKPRCIHVGPAMVAVMVRADGTFRGLHYTYLRADGGGKLEIASPETGELLPPKKVRGSKSASFIPLLGPVAPRRLFWGEGIETVLSVEQYFTGRRPDDAFWCAVDLGNLGGKALATVSHPTLKTALGRAQKVPGPIPDLDRAAAEIPESVEDLVILGDGDSDRFLTENALRRCARRYDRPGRTIRAAWADDDADFNNMVPARAAS